MPTSDDLVHRVGPDLDLERLAVERDHGRVQRLVQVVLGDGDVVVELAGDRPPQGVDDAQRRVAVADVLDQEADGVDVVDLAELRALALHLLPDAVDVLGAALELCLDPGVRQPRPQLLDGPLDVGLTTRPPGVEQLRQVPEGLGLECLEREVLQLPLDLPDTQALGERGVDLQRLARDALLLLGLEGAQGAHVVQAVGELDEDDADVVGHRQEHLPDVLGLLLLVAVGAELGQLGDAVHEVGDLGPEAVLDVGEAVLGVLGDVVEEGGRDGHWVDAELGEDLGGRDGVRHVRVARCAHLAAVRLHGQVEGAVDHREVRLRMVLADRREQSWRSASRSSAIAMGVVTAIGPDSVSVSAVPAARRAVRRPPAAPARAGASGTSGSRTTWSGMGGSLPGGAMAARGAVTAQWPARGAVSRR